MSKSNPTEILSKIHDLLLPLESNNRLKIIKACWTLLEEDTSHLNLGGKFMAGNSEDGDKQKEEEEKDKRPQNAQQYFDAKQPKGKSEELATAARYLELYLNKEELEKSDFQEIITKQARRTFDAKNFARDIGNAKITGYFVKGKKIMLASKGQHFVDKLPERTNEAKKSRASNSIKNRKHKRNK